MHNGNTVQYTCPAEEKEGDGVLQTVALALVVGGAAGIHDPRMPPPLLTCPPHRGCVCQERRVNEWARLVLFQDSYRWLK